MFGSKKVAPVIDSAKILEEARKVVMQEAFLMKRALDKNELTTALKHASTLTGELRTSALSPKEYYSLYMVASDELRALEAYIFDERERHGKKIAELYEMVQYAGNIVPRLYLMITVASAYLRSKEAPVKDILRDLVEMCRGVQHPTRGLFLRTYLSEVTKDKLPDTATEASSPEDGTVRDSVDFILANFIEMNKLWVRLHMGPLREREKREQERKELQILVGKNLARLNQLEGVDVEMYKTAILPKILEQIVQCHDRLAQQYLLEILVQVFPDDFHLATLDQLLEACRHVVPRVDVKTILVSLLDRLSRYGEISSSNSTSLVSIQALFPVFESKIEALAREPISNALLNAVPEEPVMPSAPGATGMAGNQSFAGKPRLTTLDYVTLQASLASLVVSCCTGSQADNLLDQIYGNMISYVERYEEAVEVMQTQDPCIQQLSRLVAIPLEKLGDVMRVLALSNFSGAVHLLDYARRKECQLVLLRSAMNQGCVLSTLEQAMLVFNSISTLLMDGGDMPSDYRVEKEDFEEEQQTVASAIHMIKAEDPKQYFEVLSTVRKFLGRGGKERTRFTLPSVVFDALKIATTYLADDSIEDKAKFAADIFKFVHGTIDGLKKFGYGDLALRLDLQAAQAASAIHMENFVYDFVTAAMEIYEEEITGSNEQFAALTLIIGTLHTLQFSADGQENYEILITKAAKHSLKLLRKPDQCHAVCMSSHLFWRTEFKDDKHVLECLQKSLKIADSSMSATVNVELFIEILNQYLYYFEQKNQCIQGKHLTSLLALIETNIANLEATAPETKVIRAFYQNTLAYMKMRKEAQAADPEGTKDEAQYANVEIKG